MYAECQPNYLSVKQKKFLPKILFPLLSDCVYLENQRPDQPYFVCGLKELRQVSQFCVEIFFV